MMNTERLSSHLATPSKATLAQTSELDVSRLSPHFTLAEMTKTSTGKPNVPTAAQVENLKRLCRWLEQLRTRWNMMYGDGDDPLVINSAYRSPQVNKAVGGVATSNHLTGCAADIRVSGQEQLIRYATILLDIADESQEDFDELLLERNSKGTYWLHFAVRPSGRSATTGDTCQSKNRRKIRFIQT